DNIYAYASFSVMGGHDYEGETAYSLRVFAGHEAAIDYARNLCNEGYDYAYVIGFLPSGEPDMKHVLRVADDAPEFVNLDW
ncbi:MAG: hypothetical protein ACO395_08735, partial [Pontimonas sp.]